MTLSKTAAVDGSFTFTIAASAEASQYGYAVFEGKGNPAPKALDIVCGDVSGSFDYGVFNVAEGASQTVTIECNAAADYEVFAAAITETGLVGSEVAKMECYVPDETNPAPVSFSLAADNAVAVTFSEPIVLTDKGSATVMYIQWAAGEVIGPVTLTKDNISVSGDTATFTCPKPADGAGYIVSFTEGLFADLSGNPAPGLKSGLDQSGKYVNLGWDAPTKEFAIEEESFVMWTKETDGFDPATTIDFVLPRECMVNASVRNPISVKYVTAAGEQTLYAEFELGEDGKTVKVTRPEVIVDAEFDVLVAAGAFVDAWGNPNAAFTPSKLRYVLASGDPTEKVPGIWQFTGTDIFSGTPETYEYEVRYDAEKNRFAIYGWMDYTSIADMPLVWYLDYVVDEEGQYEGWAYIAGEPMWDGPVDLFGKGVSQTTLLGCVIDTNMNLYTGGYIPASINPACTELSIGDSTFGVGAAIFGDGNFLGSAFGAYANIKMVRIGDLPADTEAAAAGAAGVPQKLQATGTVFRMSSMITPKMWRK